ncbi:MAG: hypothetical protein ACOYEV_15520 [Candidatus Nanopelagicales bacterium]
MRNRPVPQSKSMITPRRVALVVAALLALGIILANFEQTRVSLLVMHITMPLAVLLAIMFGLGWLTCELMDRVAKRRQ